MSEAKDEVKRLGRYHLSAKVGGGPLGDVYRARIFGVAGLERLFAIKLFRDDLPSVPRIREKLEAAAAKSSTLEHSRIARLHEFATTDQGTFSATEWVHGTDGHRLAKHISEKGRTMPLPIALRLASQIARAIGYAHSKGAVHGGICLHNLLFDSEGNCKVTDFGLLAACLPKRPASDPAFDSRIAFLAPEQLAGEEISPATDVFQLGLVFYQLMVGQPAFNAGGSFETAQQILSAPPPTPSDSSFPKSVVVELHRALSRLPQERHADGGSFADALDAAARVAGLQASETETAVFVEHHVDEIRELEKFEGSGTLRFPMPGAGIGPQTPASLQPDASFHDGETIDDAMEAGLETTPPPPKVPRRTTRSGLGQIAAPGLAAASEEVLTEDDFVATSDSLLPPPKPLNYNGSVVGSSPDLAAEAALADLQDEGAGAVDDEIANVTKVREKPVPVQQRGSSRKLFWTFSVIACLLSAGASYGIVRYMKEPSPVAKKEPGAVTDSDVVAVADTTDSASEDAVLDAEPGATAAGKEAIANAGAETEAVETVAAETGAAEAAAAASASAAAEAAEAAAAEAEAIAPTNVGAVADSSGASIETSPEGAAVYVGGKKVGVTPLSAEKMSAIQGGGGLQNVAVVKAGYEIFTKETLGGDPIKVTLAKVAPPSGPAGIKVKCSEKNRYYVSLNGKDTGQFCPTERLGVALGTHSVKIYDLKTGETTNHKVQVKETRLSKRLRLD